jgi:hypothetical protein
MEVMFFNKVIWSKVNSLKMESCRSVFLNFFDIAEHFWPAKKFAEPLPKIKKGLWNPLGKKRTHSTKTDFDTI